MSHDSSEWTSTTTFIDIEMRQGVFPVKLFQIWRLVTILFYVQMPRGSGTNSQGNHYCDRGGGQAEGGAYHYSNQSGSYYYQNSNV